MTDLLTPEEVENMQIGWDTVPNINRLCDDYLTLWEKHEKKSTAAQKDLETIVSLLHFCEEERDALKVRVKELEEIASTCEWCSSYPRKTHD